MEDNRTGAVVSDDATAGMDDISGSSQFDQLYSCSSSSDDDDDDDDNDEGR